ncbi:hypothetical protein FHQ18_09240 [Deferribacter autotrophicus]|uniref:Uncharacterized protein n=1 Tax=Deferribacter autotrophicus TaxID=500465 RepID=A0A5A8F6H2_9BACT|nr:hypothetical protein [Deferribacter autotrophicus]KAA0257516.1 hypothetical protein FHQ18_09240 [Deferribacter autotrophicus]
MSVREKVILEKRQGLGILLCQAIDLINNEQYENAIITLEQAIKKVRDIKILKQNNNKKEVCHA